MSSNNKGPDINSLCIPGALQDSLKTYKRAETVKKRVKNTTHNKDKEELDK